VAIAKVYLFYWTPSNTESCQIIVISCWMRQVLHNNPRTQR